MTAFRGGTEVTGIGVTPADLDEVALRLDGVARRYRQRWALRPTSLDLAAGRILGVVGPNGAGKSTLMHLALGVLRPSAGRVVAAEAVRARGSAGFGAVLDRDGLLPGLSAAANLRQWGRLVGVADPEPVLAEVGLADVGRRPVRTFSLGMRRRLALARALLADPAVLVLDEPANGLDPRGVLALHSLVRRRAAAGAAVLLSSHSLADVDGLCDDVVYLDRGEITQRWGAAATRWWRVDVDDPERARGALTGARVEDGALWVAQGRPLADVLDALGAAGIAVRGIADLGRDLQRGFRGDERDWGT